ncbi:MAG: histidine phosphatase family protein [Phycisphaeraceae bacterium]|nr:MAG: histidine phosphatase family protein [Phycisphaeraceae bacterium]
MSDARLIQVNLWPCGKTAWDEAGRLGGRTDLPLGRAGEAEASALVSGLTRGEFGVVVCGPDAASRHTAELVRKVTGAKIKVLESLAEVDVGLWEGSHRDQLRARCPSACRDLTQDPDAVVAPNGESWRAATERLTTALAGELGRQAGRKVAVVLRPLAHAILSRWLHELAGTKVAEVHDALDGSPAPARFTLERSRFAAGGVGVVGGVMGGVGSVVLGAVMWGTGTRV